MSVNIEKVIEPVGIGEGPHWDSTEEALYYVSISEKTLHRYVPKTGTRTSSQLDDLVSFIIPVSGKPQHFAAGMGRKIVELRWDGQPGTAKVVRTVCEVDQDQPRNGVNDAKADPRGRLFTGTLGPMTAKLEFEKKKGSIYRVANDGQAHKLDTGITVSNGMCWDVKEKAFYYVDSLEYGIRRYDYDIETGDISNPRIIFNYKEHDLAGFPDGMTIDTDGNLWVASFEGHQVLNIDPRTGKLIRSIEMPVKQVASVTFGGPNLSDLYVTSGCFKMDDEELKPPAGSTFKVTGLGVKGHPNLSVKWD